MTDNNIKEVMNYDLGDKFQLEDLKQRKLYINYYIDESLLEEITYHILRFNTEDKGKSIEERKPILLYCVSNGGSLADGFGLIDVILNSKTPVYTINLAYNYSMGFLIALSGHKRYAMKHSTFLMHDGSNFMYNSMAKIRDAAKFQEKQEQRIKEYVLSRSKLTEDEYDKSYRVEWYMYADQAKDKGFCDYIVGVDCSLDEII
jgi:ATP-dependent Clp protease protease subunit